MTMAIPEVRGSRQCILRTCRVHQSPHLLHLPGGKLGPRLRQGQTKRKTQGRTRQWLEGPFSPLLPLDEPRMKSPCCKTKQTGKVSRSKWKKSITKNSTKDSTKNSTKNNTNRRSKNNRNSDNVLRRQLGKNSLSPRLRGLSFHPSRTTQSMGSTSRC